MYTEEELAAEALEEAFAVAEAAVADYVAEDSAALTSYDQVKGIEVKELAARKALANVKAVKDADKAAKLELVNQFNDQEAAITKVLDAKVAAVEANKANQLKLYEALEDFWNVDNEYIAAYQELIVTDNVAIGTVHEIQENVIKAAVLADKEEAIVKEIMDAVETGNILKLQAALKANEDVLDNVSYEAANLQGYMDTLNAETTILAIQGVIDAQNTVVEKAKVEVLVKEAEALVKTGTDEPFETGKFDQAAVDAAQVAYDKAFAAAEALEGTAFDARLTAVETAIETAQGTLDAAIEAEEELQTAIDEAKAAQNDFLLAGGKKTDPKYIAVDTAITPADAEVAPTKSGVDTAKEALEKETEALVALAEATDAVNALFLDATVEADKLVLAEGVDADQITAAKALVTAYDGKTNKVEAKKTALDTLTTKATDLLAADANAELVAETIVAAEAAVADYKALKLNVGEDDSKYDVVKTNLAILKDKEVKDKSTALIALNPTSEGAEDGAIFNLNELVENITEARAAAEKAIADYVAAGGKKDDAKYTAVNDQLVILKDVEKLETNLEAAVVALVDVVDEDGKVTTKKAISALKDAKTALEFSTANKTVLALEEADVTEANLEDLLALDKAYGKLHADVKNILDKQTGITANLDAAKADFVLELAGIEDFAAYADQLDRVGNKFFGKLNADKRVEVAQMIKADVAEKAFDTLDALITSEITAHDQLLRGINNATDVDAIKTILTANLELFGLSAGEADIAASFIFDSEAKPFNTIAEIKAIF